MSRGDTGHRGVSLDDSDVNEGFCGTGARRMRSEADGGGSVGVVADDNCCRAVADCVEVGRLDLDLDGLGS